MQFFDVKWGGGDGGYRAQNIQETRFWHKGHSNSNQGNRGKFIYTAAFIHNTALKSDWSKKCPTCCLFLNLYLFFFLMHNIYSNVQYVYYK